MSKKRNGVNWSKDPNAKVRRYSAQKRLEAQLARNEKLSKEGSNVVLTEKDITRINKEISILKERQ